MRTRGRGRGRPGGYRLRGHDHPTADTWLLAAVSLGAGRGCAAVFIGYCDGSSFSGGREGSVNGLRYRGRANLDSVLDSLLARAGGLKQATDVIITGGYPGTPRRTRGIAPAQPLEFRRLEEYRGGHRRRPRGTFGYPCTRAPLRAPRAPLPLHPGGSAGGLAVYLQADHIASRLPPRAKVCLPCVRVRACVCVSSTRVSPLGLSWLPCPVPLPPPPPLPPPRLPPPPMTPRETLPK